MIGVDGMTEHSVADRLLEWTDKERGDHVFTLHAEMEGMKLAPVLERLLEGWKRQGYRLSAMRDLVEATDLAKLPLHSVETGSVPGRSGTLALQGPAFLAEESSP